MVLEWGTGTGIWDWNEVLELEEDAGRWQWRTVLEWVLRNSVEVQYFEVLAEYDAGREHQKSLLEHALLNIFCWKSELDYGT